MAIVELGPTGVSARKGDEVELYKTVTALAGGGAYSTPASYMPGSASAGWIRRGEINLLTVCGIADQASAASGVVVEESFDGSNVHVTTVLQDEDGATTVGASKAVNADVEVRGEFFRCRWTNGATLQGSFAFRVTGRVVR
jgi:hypothetical protein